MPVQSINTSEVNIQNTAKLLQKVAKELYTKNFDLNKERSRLDEILFQVAEIVFAIDQDHKVTIFNSTAEVMFDISAEDVIGKKADQFIKIYKSNNKDLLKAADYAFNKKDEVFERVSIITSEDTDNEHEAEQEPTREYFTLRSTYIEFDDNKKEAVISMSNITHEVELDHQKDEFISIASHELKTPIAVVNNNLWMLKNTSKKHFSQREKKFISEMEASLARLQKIINNLLNISRIQQNRLVFDIETHEIHSITQKIANHFIPLAKQKGLDLKPPTKNKHTKDNIELDVNKFEEIMDNFISNAIKYTQKGEIKIGINKLNNGKFYKIYVKDTGPGIPKKDHSKIFTKFGRAEEGMKLQTVGASTGLGLYISKQFVTQMGGEIGFETKMHEGTTFWFTLPKKSKIKAKAKTS